ncbi:MAG TPA: PAS domain S-box protein [Nitrospirota bacterium]|nr:PAS domain S-box protein [Nitrospirota bacterium]
MHGEARFYDDRIVFLDQDEVLHVIRDITERKRAEEALRVSEEKFRKVFYTSPDAINMNRLKDGEYVSVNEGFTRILEYTEEEAVGKTSLALNIWVDPDDRKRLVEGLREHGAVKNLEARFRGKLCEIDPLVKAIISSGYSDDAIALSDGRQGFSAFLKKPYDVASLQAVLDAMLNA